MKDNSLISNHEEVDRSNAGKFGQFFGAAVGLAAADFAMVVVGAEPMRCEHNIEPTLQFIYFHTMVTVQRKGNLLL